MRRHIGRPFLGSTVDIGRYQLAVPMKQFRRVGVIVNVDDDAFAFSEVHEGAWKLAIIERS